MIEKLIQFFSQEQPSTLTIPEKNKLIQTASAALLIEIATIDDDFALEEQTALFAILKETFHFSDNECQTLKAAAEIERDNAASLHQFTHIINQHCNEQEKFELIKNMWRIAFADQRLDKYEEHMIRKASELIHVSHSQFILAKKHAQALYKAN